ncbi:MAG TPA: HupE/UreJ family protein [Candidatus Angelobacter sp.]|nr:HupE/UreJ family protein [Candidatus Angelobacter sp.]
MSQKSDAPLEARDSVTANLATVSRRQGRKKSRQRLVSDSTLPWLVGILALVLLPQPALAHITQGPTGGFASGFAHPLTGLDHFLAMFAVGVWGAQMGGRSVWALPVAFPLVMTVGGIAGMAGLVLPYVEIGIALSILVLGLAIACKWRPVEVVPLALIAIFALCHGYAHGVELPNAADPAAYAVGFVLATGMIHITGIVVGLLLGKPLHGWLARGVGAVIAAGGVFYLVA